MIYTFYDSRVFDIAHKFEVTIVNAYERILGIAYSKLEVMKSREGGIMMCNSRNNYTNGSSSCNRRGERIIVNQANCGENRKRNCCVNTYRPNSNNMHKSPSCSCGCSCHQTPCPPRPCLPRPLCEERCREQYRKCIRNCRLRDTIEPRDCYDYDNQEMYREDEMDYESGNEE